MNPEDAAARTTDAIAYLPAGFMLDGATYERGGALGFDGVDFYVAGRGGALGDVDGSVVAAAFVFFNPTTVVDGWERARKVMSPPESALAFAGCCHAWAEGHLPDDVDYSRLAELQGRLIAGSSPAGAPLFAGWAAQPEPASPKALALHRMNVLRELRGGLHGAAVLGHGLSPLEALVVKTPFMASLFGWEEPLPDAEPHKAAWDRAEESTNRALIRTFAVLDEAERDELVDLVNRAHAGAG
ncbi:MAG: SCO6745 family protein [Acidimicrobiales bacterium]